MPLGIRPGWVMTPDGCFVHTKTRKVLKSLSGMRLSVQVVGRARVDSVRAGALPVPLGFTFLHVVGFSGLGMWGTLTSR